LIDAGGTVHQARKHADEKTAVVACRTERYGARCQPRLRNSPGQRRREAFWPPLAAAIEEIAMSENLHRLFETNHTIINSSAGGVLPVAAALANNRSSIYALILTTPSAVTVTVQDTASVALSQPFAFGANGGAVTVDIKTNGDPWWQSALGVGLQLFASAAVQVSADVYWLQTP
jgi:hypothetical protein